MDSVVLENKFKHKTEYISFPATNISELIEMLQNTQEQNPNIKISGGNLECLVEITKSEVEARISKRIILLKKDRDYYLSQLRDIETYLANLEKELEKLWKDE